MMNVLPKHDEMPNWVRFERDQRVGLGIIPRGEKTVIASYWRVSNSHIRRGGGGGVGASEGGSETEGVSGHKAIRGGGHDDG